MADFPLMDKENFFYSTDALGFPSRFPYQFALDSTESESDDEDVAGLTRRFSRSASLKETLYDFKEKRAFSGSPESTLGWFGCIPFQVPSPSPVVKGDEDARNLIYAAAGEVARMKMRMSISNSGDGGLLGATRSVAQPNCTPWGRTDREEFFLLQQFCRNKGDGGGGCGGHGAPTPYFPHSAWTPQQLLQQHRQNQHKPAVSGGSGGGATPAKRECTGTGVFLPRRYCKTPTESRKRPACSSPHLPARTIQFSNKSFASNTVPTQFQARNNGGSVPNSEMLMGRKNTMVLAAQSNIHGSVVESPVNNPELLLPQEWIY